MHPTYHVTADSAARAHQIGINRAHADGWQSIVGVFVNQLDRNTYSVEVVVAGLRR